MSLATLNKSLRASQKQSPILLIITITRAWHRNWHMYAISKYFLKGDAGTDPEQSVKYGEGSQNHIMS